MVVPGALSLALLLAFLVQPLRPRTQTFFKAAFYLPGVVSSVVLALVWAWLYNADFGLLNYLLSLVGVDPGLWLGDRRVALPAIALMTVVSGLGVPLLLLLASMGAIPDTYYEAARIDGAGPVRQFFAVTLPLLKPTLLYLLIVMTIGSFQVFETVYLMTNGGPSYATTTLVFLIYESAFRYYDFGLASAQAVVLFMLVAAMAVVQFTWLGGDVEY
jgi:multiple sugar transport system permease protein